MTRLFDRLQNLEGERNLDWIKVDAAKRNPRRGRTRRAKQKKETEAMNDKIHTRLVARRIHRDCRCGGLPRRRRPGRVSDRDRLRPRRRRHQRRRGARLYAAKGRPSFNPLIAHVSDLAAARAARGVRRRGRDARRRVLAGAADAGAAEARRLPGRRSGHRGARQHRRAGAGASGGARLLSRFGRPVVAPSANRSGHVSPTTRRSMCWTTWAAASTSSSTAGRRRSASNPPSSPARRPVLLRPGGLPREADRSACSAARSPIRRSAPMPKRRSRRACSTRITRRARGSGSTVDSRQCRRGAARVRPETAARDRGCRDRAQPVAERRPRRGRRPTCSPTSAARYRDVATIAVMPVPNEGLGEAINDRLRAPQRQGRSAKKERKRTGDAAP